MFILRLKRSVTFRPMGDVFSTVAEYLCDLLFWSFLRHSVHPPSGRETGDSWHGCRPVGWEQTNPWERGVQHAGGVSGSRERVSTMILLFYLNHEN